MSSAHSPIRIRRATVADADAIAEIYNHEVEFETSTFDLVPRTIAAQKEWIEARSGAFSAIVAVDENDAVVGFGALSEYRDRAAYKTSVENSVYVRRNLSRSGIGKLILTNLLEQAADSGFHVVMARIEASSHSVRRARVTLVRVRSALHTSAVVQLLLARSHANTRSAHQRK